eukprot:6199228-Pleurochrysis_carterae.AAC.2
MDAKLICAHRPQQAERARARLGGWRRPWCCPPARRVVPARYYGACACQRNDRVGKDQAPGASSGMCIGD